MKGGCFIVIALLLGGLLLSFDSGAQTTQQKQPASLEKRVSDCERDLSALRKETNPFSSENIPETFLLFDKKAPLYRDEIRERYERELFQVIEHKGLMVIIIKRYFKYYNIINEEIQKANVPSDLIYLVIAESYLNPRSVSRAQAAGMWQFIQETGKREGLYISETIDERYNVRKSTRSALNHLKRLYGDFGDWFIAVAAYNAGPQRLREVIANQNTKDFFDMHLPEETERYLFRIMAMKEVITNHEKYGITIYEKDLYRPVAVSEVWIEVTKELHTNVLAKSMDVSYKTFRENNLHLRRYRLPPGTYLITVPSDKKEGFLKRLQGYEHVRVVKTSP